MAKPPLKNIALFKGKVGICVHDWSGRLSDAEFDDIATFASWVRFDAAWNSVETKRDTFTWTAMDYYVDACVARGLIPVIILAYANATAYGSTTTYSDGTTRPVADRLFTSAYHGVDTAAQRERYVNFCTKVAERYVGQGVAYEIWNEPYGNGWWKPRHNVSAYLQMCREACAAIKLADPDAYIFAMGGTGILEDGTWTVDASHSPTLRRSIHSDLMSRDYCRDWFKQLIAGGVARDADAVSVHIYNGGMGPEASRVGMRWCKSITDVPVANTEGGYAQAYALPRYNGYYTLNGWGVSLPMTEEERSLANLRKMLVEVAEGAAFSTMFSFRQNYDNPALNPAVWGRRDNESGSGAYLSALVESTYGWSVYAPTTAVASNDHYLKALTVKTAGRGYPRPVPYSDYGDAAIPAAGVTWKPELVVVDDAAQSMTYLHTGRTGSGLTFPNATLDSTAKFLGVNGADTGAVINAQCLYNWAPEFPGVDQDSTDWAPLRGTVTTKGSGMGGLKLRFTGYNPVTSRAVIPVDAMTCADPEFATGQVVAPVGRVVRMAADTVNGLHLAKAYWYITSLDYLGGIDEVGAGSGWKYTVGDALTDDGRTLAAGLSSGSGLAITVNYINSIGGVISGVTITSGGTGYKVGDLVTFSGGTGEDAVGIVLAVSSGVVTSFAMQWGGLYLTAPRTIQVSNQLYPTITTWTNKVMDYSGDTITDATDIEIILNNSHVAVEAGGAGYAVSPSVTSSWESVNEIWGVVTDVVPTGGTFRLTAYGVATADLAHTTTAAELKAEIVDKWDTAGGLTTRNTHVVGGPLSAGVPFTIQFVDDLRATATGATLDTTGTALTGAAAVTLTFDKAQVGASSDSATVHYSGAEPQALTVTTTVDTGAVTLASLSLNASQGAGHYYHKVPSTHVVYGPESVEAYAITHEGSVVDTVIYNCGVGLDPADSSTVFTVTPEHVKDRARIIAAKGPNHLYAKRIAKGSATFANNTKYRLYHIGNADGGHFHLSMDGNATGAIAYASATAANIQAAIRAVAGYEGATVTTAGDSQSTDKLPVPMDIEFEGSKVNTSVVLTVDGVSLTSSAGTIFPYGGTRVPCVHEASSYGADSYVTAWTNEQQTLKSSAAPNAWTGGTFTLSHTDAIGVVHTTAPIAWNADAATIQTALNAATMAGAFTVAWDSVGTDAIADTNATFTVTFQGYPGHARDVALLAYDLTNITSAGTPALTVTELVAGGYAQIVGSIEEDAVGDYGQVTEFKFTNCQQGTYPDGEYQFCLDQPYSGELAHVEVELGPKPQPRQQMDVLTVFKSIGSLMDGYLYIQDENGKPYNISGEDGTYHLRLTNPATGREARIIWADPVEPCTAVAQASLIPLCGTALCGDDDAVITTGYIRAVDITDSGVGYDPNNPPAVTFTGGGGTGAEAEAIMFNGQTIAAIQVTARGAGYYALPTVTVDTFAPTPITLPTYSQAYNWRGTPTTLTSPYTPTGEPVFLFL